MIFFKRAAAAPALSTPPPKKKASDKLNRRTSSTTRTATAPSPLRALSSPRATGGLHFSRRAPPKASPARTPLGIATQSPNVQANAPSLSASSASTSCSDVEVEKATVVSASSHRETPSCADGEAGEHSSSAKDNKDEDGKQEASPSSSSLEEVMSKYKAHHAHLEHHIHALETSESTADTSADHATAASTREELLADFKAREEEVGQSAHTFKSYDTRLFLMHVASIPPDPSPPSLVCTLRQPPRTQLFYRSLKRREQRRKVRRKSSKHSWCAKKLHWLKNALRSRRR